MPEYSTIMFAVTDKVAHLTLNRPEAANSAQCHGLRRDDGRDVAAGGGMGLAYACDLVIAAQSARFTMAYTKVGLSPDGTTSYFLPRRIGIGRAMELVLLNRTLSAGEALDWGIANRVVADASLAEEAHSTAAQLATRPTRAYGAAKRLMHVGFTEGLETQIERNSAASRRWRVPKILAKQLRPSEQSEHLCSPGAEWARVLE